MEIHAPDHPITTWKQTFKHLAIITVGVLIALTLEGAVSWIDHRLLVREATANLTAELRDNDRELTTLFANLAKERQQLEHADEIAAIVLAHKPLEDLELTLESHGAELKNAAMVTAQVTGAFGHMEYGEVSRYAYVYDLQTQFVRLQERQWQNVWEVLAFVRRIGASDERTDDQVQRWRGQIDVALTGILEIEQVGGQLQQRYRDALARR